LTKSRNFSNSDLKFTAKYDRKETYDEEQARRAVDVEDNSNRGRHESWENYEVCKKRWRNSNLFTADQELNDRSCATRQNNGCTKRGFECPEERDYFPYWHPTEWTDIAILTNNIENCDYYQNESSNSAPKGECVEYYETLVENPGRKMRKAASMENNKADCIEHGGEWIEFYDYLQILEEVTEEKSCLRIDARIKRHLREATSGVIWNYPRKMGKDRHDLPVKQCLILHPVQSSKNFRLLKWTFFRLFFFEL